MRFRLPRPRDLAVSLRELARRDPDEAEEYLDAHQEEWEALAESVPEEAADILEAIDEMSAAELIVGLDTEPAGEVLDEMRSAAAAEVIEELEPDQAARLIAAMDHDQAVDILELLDEPHRTNVINGLDPSFGAEVRALLEYPADTAGGMMTRDIAVLPADITAGEAIESLRRLHDELGSNLSYVYATDDAHRLLGVISFRDLVFARPGDALADVMITNPVHVRTDTDREELAELLEQYHLLAIPVVDDRGRLVGMVRFDTAIAAIREEAGEDIAVMVGAGVEETIFSPVRQSVRRRLPWIGVNLVIGFMVAFVIRAFETTIEGTAVLAAYMPIVAQLGGNSGAQSLAIVIRGMAVGDVTTQRIPRILRREVIIGLINGAAISVVAGVVGGVIAGSTRVGVVLVIAVVVNMAVAGLAGSGIPVLLRALRQDPALASNIFLTMVTDVIGFGGFLLTAALLI